jgi:DNA-binding NarL/FixJ family response regulator
MRKKTRTHDESVQPSPYRAKIVARKRIATVPTIRLLIADDHPATRHGLAALLKAESDFEIVAIAADGPAAVERALRGDVDVIVMDVKMPGLDGIDAAHRIKEKRAEVGVVIFSSYVFVSHLRELLGDGRLGYAYLLKTASIEQLAAAIRTVAAGGLFIDPQVGQRASAPTRLTRLTDRENDVLQLLIQGADNAAIGERLKMQPGTVSMHISNIYSKLELDGVSGMNPRVAAVLMYHGLLE